jgi:voltage-gated potassium channel
MGDVKLNGLFEQFGAMLHARVVPTRGVAETTATAFGRRPALYAPPPAGSAPKLPNTTVMASWAQEESGRVRTPLEPVVLAATLALIPVLIIESDAKSQTWQNFAKLANWVIWAVFAVELAAILIVATRKKAALRAHWLDVAIVVLTVPFVTEALSWLRLARFIRLARIGALATRAVQAERRIRITSGDSLRIAAILTLTAIVIGGAAEQAVASDDFPTLWDSIWWAVVTVTTVGYGNLYPTTVQGRLIGILLMFVGIAFLSLLTAAIASRFVRQDAEVELADVMEALQRIEADVAELKARNGP